MAAAAEVTRPWWRDSSSAHSRGPQSSSSRMSGLAACSLRRHSTARLRTSTLLSLDSADSTSAPHASANSRPPKLAMAVSARHRAGSAPVTTSLRMALMMSVSSSLLYASMVAVAT